MRRETITFDGIPYWYMEIEMSDGNVIWVGEYRIKNVLERYMKYDRKYGGVAKWIMPLFDMFVHDWLLEEPNHGELLKLLDRSPLGERYQFTSNDDRI